MKENASEKLDTTGKLYAYFNPVGSSTGDEHRGTQVGGFPELVRRK